MVYNGTGSYSLRPGDPKGDPLWNSGDRSALLRCLITPFRYFTKVWQQLKLGFEYALHLIITSFCQEGALPAGVALIPHTIMHSRPGPRWWRPALMWSYLVHASLLLLPGRALWPVCGPVWHPLTRHDTLTRSPWWTSTCWPSTCVTATTTKASTSTWWMYIIIIDFMHIISCYTWWAASSQMNDQIIGHTEYKIHLLNYLKLCWSTSEFTEVKPKVGLTGGLWR